MISGIKSGDILLSKYIPEPDLSFDILSFLMNALMDGDYLHAGIVFDDGRWLGNSSSVVIGEALYEGFVLRYYKDERLERKIKKGRTDIYRYHDQLSKRDRISLRSSIQEYMGREYSIKDLFKILFYKIMRHRVFTETTNKVTCAEVIARAYEDIGISLTDEVDDLDLVTPNTLSQSKYLHEVSLYES